MTPRLCLLAQLLLLLLVASASSQPPTAELPRPLTPRLRDWQQEEAETETAGELSRSFGHRDARSRRPTLMDVALQQSVRQGLDAMFELYGKIQPEMLRNGQTLQDNHPAALLARFNAPNVDTERREMAAYATIAATKAFRKNFQHIDELARQSHAHKISLRRTALEALCPAREPPACMPAAERYRTHDGTCNNKRRPRWGGAQMPFNRFLPPEYGDGVDSVRSSTDGSTLSSSRFVSLLVHGARDGEAPLTLMIAQWGQLLDHDMTSTAQPRSINGSIPSCCGGKDFHPSCFPIKVPLDDPWLAPLKVRCLEFLRSAPAQRRDCVLSWREQTNQATSYIDASPIYSNSAKLSDNARVFRSGLLIYGRGNPSEDVCQRGAMATQCIRAGDGRSGEQPGLLAMHHVWVGEHNRIAQQLAELNAHWSDEKVYQETRRIVGAMFQHITYREFLPIVLGREVCKLFDLDLLEAGYFEGYNSKVNPTVGNAFAAAAFRFGHSLVQNSYMRCDRHHNVINNNVSLHEEFQRGDIGSAGSLHRLLRGLATQRALKRDEFITPELTNHLFQTPGFPFGLDLAAINIQRGRDHGIAPYSAWRVPCGLSPIHNWDDFANVVGPESATRIGNAYRSVHDIDLFVGGIAERPVVGGLVGPTFACIIAQQFSNSRRGDRFWYENGGFESSFTPAQLHSLRHVSLAQVLCRAVGGGTFQPHIFIPSEFTDNERLTCGDGVLAPIDLSPWLEQDPFVAAKPRPDQVFNNGLGAVQIVKEDKAGFSNRIKPSSKPHIDFIPNSAIGFQRPSNSTKINDKLDLKHKTQTATQTSTQNRKPVPSRVHNKLDQSKKVKRPAGTTTRRTVIINNVPIELRSAAKETNGLTLTETQTDTVTKTETKTETENGKPKKTETKDKDRLESRSGEATLDETDLTETTSTPIATRTANLTVTLTPELTRTARDSKRVLELKASKTDSKLLHNRTTASPNAKATATASPSTTAGRSIRTTRSSHTTKTSKLSKTTKRGLELRSQYQSRPIYTRPQKVVVNGPNADQYEIEINIRQTNKNPSSTRPLTPDYAEYTTVYKPQNSYDSSYSSHYSDYGSTTPAYAFAHYQPPATVAPTKTKPPTIIYLNDFDDRRPTTTTRQPNIFQNFLTFATNGFNPNGNRRPSPAQERPQFDNFVVNSPLSPHSVSSSSYSPAPTHSQSVQSYPAVSSSQIGIGLHPQSGYVHASSSAISAGSFGSISGVASANGADSTFSFNIRPRPDVGSSVVSSYPRPQHLGGSYGLASSHKPDYPQTELYYNRELAQAGSHSPFSNSAQRPQQSQTYYARAPELKEAQHNEVSHVPDHKLDILDYDFLSRTLTNLTTAIDSDLDSDNSHLVYDDEDYVYDEEVDNMDVTNRDASGVVTPTRKYDRDGYLRPELMLGSLGTDKRVLETRGNGNMTNATNLDDNYVLPMLTNKTYKTELSRPMTRNQTNSKITVFTESIAKQLDNDILADDYEDEHTPKSAQLTNVAFAPITVLTKPDRPDNWLIYDKAIEEPPLPQLPVVSMDSAPTAEVPMPIRGVHDMWRRRDFGLLRQTSEATATTKAEQEVSGTTETSAMRDEATTVAVTESTTNAK